MTRVEEFRAEVLRYLGADADGLDERVDGPWWMGTCDSSVYALEEAGILDAFADLEPAPVLWGGFRRAGDRVGTGHCWILLGDGTIVDPTSQQFGLEPCAVVAPSDPRHAWYEGGTHAVWTVMADDVVYATRRTRAAAQRVVREQRRLVEKFGRRVRVVQTVSTLRR